MNSVTQDGSEKLTTPQTREDVARILGIEDKTLIYYLYRYENETSHSLYTCYQVPKRNGEMREIMAPIFPLKRIQRKLADYLNKLYEPKQNIYGFIPKRGAVIGAAHHLKAKLLLNLDLMDFFGSINFGRVRGMFIKPPYNFGMEAATVIAQIACVKNKLPQGAPSSPVLANMICSHLDTALIKIAKKYHMLYSRYADDITFSMIQNVEYFPKAVAFRDESGKAHVGVELENIVRKCGFVINDKKVFIQKSTQRQMVTGIVVNEKLNVPREYNLLTKALLYRCEKDGIEAAAKYYISKSGVCYNVPDDVGKFSSETLRRWFQSVLVGRITYIGFVKGTDDKVYMNYALKCRKLFGENVFGNVKRKVSFDTLMQSVLLIEVIEGEEYSQGSAFYVEGVGIVTAYHCVESTIENDIPACVYTVDNMGEKKALCRIRKKDVVKSQKDIDYAVLKCDNPNGLSGFTKGHFNPTDNHHGEKVCLLGYGEFMDGDTVSVLDSSVSGKRNFYLGAPLFCVSHTVTHGMSGGPVLNGQCEVIGVIKGGVSTIDEAKYAANLFSGFIAIENII